MDEDVLEPDLPIVDSHHHLYPERELAPLREGVVDRRVRRYLLEDISADIATGHNVVATVYVQAHQWYRTDGPEELKPVGETEFVRGIAESSETGNFGPAKVAAGIVGATDFRLGDRVKPVLEAHIEAAGGRFRGIRQSASWDADPNVMGDHAEFGGGLYLTDDFRSGFGQLAPLGLTFDAWVLEPQIPDVTSLARAFPDTTIILCHTGTPLNIGPYRGRREERYPDWLASMTELAAEPNVVVKLGGLGIAFPRFPSFRQVPAADSSQLAGEWATYIEPSIQLFGPDRCMFESDFPQDSETGNYPTFWNAFKRITAGYTPDEKNAMYNGTARRVYRLDYQG